MILLLTKLVRAMGWKRTLILLFTVLAAAAIICGWKYLFGTSAAQQVSVTRAVAGPLNVAEGFSGVFDERNFTIVSARVSGVINKVSVQVGDKVKRGEVLARFVQEPLHIQYRKARGTLRNAQANFDQAVSDNPFDIQQLKALVAQDRTDYDTAKTDYDRSRALFAAGAASQSDLDASKSKMLNAQESLAMAQAKLQEAAKDSNDRIAALRGLLTEAKAGVESAQYALTNSLVKTPVAGTVIERDVDPGMSISNGAALFKIADVTDLLFKARVNQMFLSYFADHEPVHIICDDLRGTDISGTVERIYPVPTDSLQPQYSDNTDYEVDIALSNPSTLIRQGMTGQLLLNIHIPGTIMLPEDAIVYNNNKDSVFVVNNGLACEQVVQLGIKRGTKWEVVSGIHDKDEVILNPGDLTDGQRVHITNIETCPSDKVDY